MALFLFCRGYNSEVWSYILSLHENQHSHAPSFKTSIQQHGDLLSFEFWEGLPNHMRELAGELHRTKCQMNETIVVFHSEPGAWNPPLFETMSCPTISDYGSFMAVIDKTMFETDIVSPEHVKRCNIMDYVWVPTELHMATFVDNRVDPSKVVKIVQPIDVGFFDLVAYEALELSSIGELVLGKKTRGLKFVFLSIFKWEYRKA